MSDSMEPKSQILTWLAGQPFNNVLIAALLGMIGWLGYYGLTVAVPQHLSTIQSGYEKIEMRYSDRAKSDRETFENTLSIIVDRDQKKPSTMAGK